MVVFLMIDQVLHCSWKLVRTKYCILRTILLYFRLLSRDEEKKTHFPLKIGWKSIRPNIKVWLLKTIWPQAFSGWIMQLKSMTKFCLLFLSNIFFAIKKGHHLILIGKSFIFVAQLMSVSFKDRTCTIDWGSKIYFFNFRSLIFMNHLKSHKLL